MAGYSATPLAKKLGVREDALLLIEGAPPGFEALLAPLPAGVEVVTKAPRTREIDVAIAFLSAATKLDPTITRIRARLAQNGGLWIAWPKKASKVQTDVTEDRVRDVGLAQGLVDNKVCAIDEVWSGLRLVIRVKDRRPNAR
ncbi:MAG: DUF3052 domain-containing protein [Myxococcota bacterium]